MEKRQQLKSKQIDGTRERRSSRGAQKSVEAIKEKSTRVPMGSSTAIEDPLSHSSDGRRGSSPCDRVTVRRPSARAGRSDVDSAERDVECRMQRLQRAAAAALSCARRF